MMRNANFVKWLWKFLDHSALKTYIKGFLFSVKNVSLTRLCSNNLFVVLLGLQLKSCFCHCHESLVLLSDSADSCHIQEVSTQLNLFLVILYLPSHSTVFSVQKGAVSLLLLCSSHLRLRNFMMTFIKCSDTVAPPKKMTTGTKK